MRARKSLPKSKGMVASSDKELSDLEEEVVAVRARKSLSQVKKHRVVVDTL